MSSNKGKNKIGILHEVYVPIIIPVIKGNRSRVNGFSLKKSMLFFISSSVVSPKSFQGRL